MIYVLFKVINENGTQHTVFENHRKKSHSRSKNFDMTKNWWKMPKLKNSDETFWVIFKHCATINDQNLSSQRN